MVFCSFLLFCSFLFYFINSVIFLKQKPQQIFLILKRRFNQFSEIWGLEELDVEEIKLLTTIDTLLISNINIDTATIEKLRHHPYLNYKQDKMIVNYRAQHGVFRSVKDIQKIRPISPEIFRKIAPYLQTHD